MTTHNIQAKTADRPDVAEEFADSILGCWFDGNTWRIELGVTRIDHPAKDPASMTMYPSCRVVLSVPGGLALIDRLNDLVKQLEANGTLKKTPIPPTTTMTH